MININDIYRSIEYIEANLKNKISVETVAVHTGYSLYYFSRVFNKATGHSPYDYIMRRRLSQAAIDLIRTNKKIIDIAFEYQFNNPETFTRAFNKMFKCLPSSINTENDLDNLVLKDQIKKHYLKYINDPDFTIKKEVIEKKHFNLIGIITNDVDYIITKNQLINNKINIKIPESEYILYFHPERYNQGGNILKAYEVTSLETIPSIYVGKKIPQQKYLKFQIQASVFNIKYVFQYIYQTILKIPNINEKTPYAFEKNNTFNDKGYLRALYIPIYNMK